MKLLFERDMNLKNSPDLSLSNASYYMEAFLVLSHHVYGTE